MRNPHDRLSELRRQLELVRRRVDETVVRLRESSPDLTADGLEGVEAGRWAEGRGDLFHLCVRLEVALAESNELADRLKRRLNELSGQCPQSHFARQRLDQHGVGGPPGSRN
jgi:hypothetical protein